MMAYFTLSSVEFSLVSLSLFTKRRHIFCNCRVKFCLSFSPLLSVLAMPRLPLPLHTSLISVHHPPPPPPPQAGPVRRVNSAAGFSRSWRTSMTRLMNTTSCSSPRRTRDSPRARPVSRSSRRWCSTRTATRCRIRVGGTLLARLFLDGFK